jgi:hypothetical protein
MKGKGWAILQAIKENSEHPLTHLPAPWREGRGLRCA